MGDQLAEIKAKCEQYWNENRIDPVEVHAILEFIHVRTVDTIAEVEGLKADLLTVAQSKAELREEGMEAAAVECGKWVYAQEASRSIRLLTIPTCRRAAAKELADGKGS